MSCAASATKVSLLLCVGGRRICRASAWPQSVQARNANRLAIAAAGLKASLTQRPSSRQHSTAIFAAPRQPSTVEMEVTKHNFNEVLPLVKEALSACQFFAIDCEMTGLFLDHKPSTYLDDLEDRYQETLASSRAFVINQFGLSAFVWEDGAYRPRTFNFYLFPRPFEGSDKRFVCQASSLDFLASCGFDFNKAIYDGISYMPVTQRDARLAAVDRKERERSEVLVKKTEDVAFVQETVQAVAEWLQGGERELLLPPVNAFQRLLQYQELRRPQFGVEEGAGFYVERVQAEDGYSWQLRLTRANPEEAAAWEAEQRQKRIDAINEAAGFAAVMEAMRDCGKPMVGHNLSFDLAYSLHSYAQELPASWEEYKELAGRWFPGGIFDTKHLAGLLRDVFPDTSLGFIHDGLLKGQLQEEVAAFLRRAAASSSEDSSGAEEAPAADVANGDADLAPAQLPPVAHADGYERYQGVDTAAYAHEAGYDAYMTGAAFACLVRLFEAQAAGGSGAAADQQPQLSAVDHLRWRINLSRSDYPYAALQGKDPQPDRSHIFYVTGWGEGQRVYGGDITKKLADAQLGQVRASVVEEGLGALVEVGDAEAVPGALEVLQQRLSGWTVAPYADYAEKRRQQRAEAAAAAGAEREAAAARRAGTKRPRVEMEAAAVPARQNGTAAAPGEAALGRREGGWGRCSIM